MTATLTRPALDVATATPEAVDAWYVARVEYIRSAGFSPEMKAALYDSACRTVEALLPAAEAVLTESVLRLEASLLASEDVYPGEDGKCYRRVTVWKNSREGKTMRRFRPFEHVIRDGACLYCSR